MEAHGAAATLFVPELKIILTIIMSDSDILFPLTIEGALIRGWELMPRSQIARRGQVLCDLFESSRTGKEAVNGGLTDFLPPGGDHFLLDQDQRNTLHCGGNVNLPWSSCASTDIYYGSWFTNGNAVPPELDHLPGHTTLDVTRGETLANGYR
jgi:hypothetical protein